MKRPRPLPIMPSELDASNRKYQVLRGANDDVTGVLADAPPPTGGD
jgi:hypothetical protein